MKKVSYNSVEEFVDVVVTQCENADIEVDIVAHYELAMNILTLLVRRSNMKLGVLLEADCNFDKEFLIQISDGCVSIEPACHGDNYDEYFYICGNISYIHGDASSKLLDSIRNPKGAMEFSIDKEVEEDFKVLDNKALTEILLELKRKLNM